MRRALTLYFTLLFVLEMGCGSHPEPNAPLITGKLEGGTFWNRPLTATGNEGNGFDKGSKAEVYEQFVVITTSDGVSHVYPHGNYIGLLIKKD